MVDLSGVDKGNISLPPRLQSPEVLDAQPDDLKQVMILNMQKAFYQVRITDIAKRIQRLQTRNTELEESCVTEKLLRSQTDIETGDQIAQRNRQIYSEVEKITDYKKRIQIVQKWMDEEKQAHLDKVEAANQKYAKTRLAIMSEIKVLNAKINTLEEYKVSKTDLRDKLITGNNLLARRDEEAKQRCEQTQRKFKIGREKLKKEMYARLQGLAETFQTEVAASIAKPIHRLMRENIFLKNELMDTVKESMPKKEKNKQKKEINKRTIVETAALKKCTVEDLIASKIQGYLLAAVEEQHTKLKDCIERLKQSDKEKGIKSAENTYSCSKIKADNALQYISRLETSLHRQQTQLGFTNYLKDRSQTELQRCINILYDAKYAVACALNMTNTGKDILDMGDRQLMSYLLDILCKGDSETWKNRTPSLASVPPPEEAYKIGDLGIETSLIQLRGVRKTLMQRKPSKLSTSKTFTALGVRLTVPSSTRSHIRPATESEDSTDEKTNGGSRKSSLSLSIQKEVSEQKLALPEAVEKEDRKTDGVSEAKTKAEAKTETEEKVAQGDGAKQDEITNNETITEDNEEDESAIPLKETDESSSQENSTQE